MANLTNSAWPKFQGNLQNTGVSAYSSVQSNPEPKWVFTCGGEVNGSPVIGPDNTIYFGSNDNKIYAVDGSTGQRLWFYTLGGQCLATPVIGDNGLLYVPCSNGYLYALYTTAGVNSVPGGLAWTFNSGSDNSGQLLESPTIVNGLLFFGSTNHRFYCINASTGVLNWFYDTQDNNGYWKSPVVSSDKQYIYNSASTGFVYRFLVSSTLSFIRTYTNQGGFNNGMTSPVIAPDGNVYVLVQQNQGDTTLNLYKVYYSGYGGSLTIELVNVNSTLTNPQGYTPNTPAIDSNSNLYVFAGGVLLVVNLTTKTIDGNANLSPTEQNPRIYTSPVIGADGTIYLGTAGGYIYAFQSARVNSTTKWVYKTDGSIKTQVAIGSDGTLYFGSTDKNLYAITTRNNNAPCFLRGTMILTTDGEVAVEDLTKNHKVITYGDINNEAETITHNPSVANVQEVIKFKTWDMNEFSRPICFKKDSMTTNCPSRDLYLSPQHSVALVWKTIVQAMTLVNGDTIAYDMSCDSAEYYHIVLKNHSVIFASNMAVESLRVDGFVDGEDAGKLLHVSNSIDVY